MSYILDALRKSDLQRQHGMAPTLQTAPLRAGAHNHPHAWIYAVLGLLLTAAGVAIGVLRPWQSAGISSEQGAIAPVEPRRIVEPPPVALESVVAPEPRRARADAPRPAPSHEPVMRKEAPKRAAVPPPAPTANSSDAKTVALGDLPPAVQQELPPLAITVHAYSQNAADRMVGINNSIVREGATVAPGVKLEEITLEGMVLSYKGYRFRRGVQN